ncbi:hypothetical protein NLJ89_g6363 [Agrocybe chaxingu]|uniref:Uncharacterized protein n=1 Tax=Agrocybe chaxingu TaxID=84603 RepID=A0A9W8K6K1_9AGAR|nr:hypothetical protein NLJ89_g6363 [Agrocybe chaxingu]
MGTLSSTLNQEIEDDVSTDFSSTEDVSIAEEDAPTTEDYVPTAEDVVHVRQGLLQKVPPELANVILEEGRYWPKATAVFWPQQDVEVSASKAPNINAARVLILTPALSDWIDVDMPLKIRELSIKIESHDQGWCGEDPNLPPYAASWTWFEAIIVRDAAYSNSNPETDSKIKRFLENTDRGTESPSVQTVRNPQSTYDPDAWVIQRNVRASRGHTTHNILWTAESVDDVETRESLDDTGAGRGAGFASSLEMGDRIAIIARARPLVLEQYVKSPTSSCRGCRATKSPTIDVADVFNVSIDRFIPTLEEVFTAQVYMSERVPPELANDILDYARYWAQVGASCPANDGEGKVISAQLREVRFKLKSHDQGWATENSSPLPYLPSWTWFEASTTHNARYTASFPEEAFIKKTLAKIRLGKEAKSSVNTVRNPPGLGDDVWYIQWNIRASSVFRSHEVILEEDNKDVASGRVPGKTGNGGTTGAGSRDGFISALQKKNRNCCPSESQASDPEPPRFIPTPHEVFIAQTYLSERVPPELAIFILNHARYWPKVSTSFRADDETGKMVYARHRHSGKYISAEVLVLTPTLAKWTDREFFKIREVRVKLESHDQGWCSDDSSPHRYVPSWTWFEAAIIRDPRHLISSPEADASVKKALANSRCERELEPSVITVRNPHAPAGRWEDVWDVQRNMRAHKVFASHEVCFQEDSEDVASGKTPGRIGSDCMTGAGSGDGFVGALEKWDRIAIIARAMYPGWANFVRKIELEVYYSV